MSIIKINPKDTVAVDTETGHKIALRNIESGEMVIKYGFPIGTAYKDIAEGERVHTDNLKTALGEKIEYTYEPKLPEAEAVEPATVNAYVRENGDIGIRNDIWIIPTVGCVNGTARKLAELTGAIAVTHPYGCSQLGGDHATTQKILRGLVNHPNAGGVLVLGLGCENNNIAEFKKILGEVNPKRVKFLNAQEFDDDIAEGVRLIGELKEYAESFRREPVSVSKLKIGLKCGGSDGLSGITANPLIGRLSDRVIAMGGTCVLTEVPEMFGAETILMNRCIDSGVFDKTVSLINNFKDYFTNHGQVVYENPSPGNKAGGITTLEEKSLGCIQKGGSSAVVDVLDYGDTATKNGLNLLNGPGNDIVAVTNLVACGCQMVLFSTGRGTPLGTCVPTVKVSTNSRLSASKSSWIDFNAGEIINGQDLDDDFFNYVIGVANGNETANERNGYRDIAIFKDGVTL